MFVIHTGLMVEMSICFLNDVKSTYERIDGRLNLQAQLVEALFARINVCQFPSLAEMFLGLTHVGSTFSVILSSYGERGRYLRVFHDSNLVMFFPCVSLPHSVS